MRTTTAIGRAIVAIVAASSASAFRTLHAQAFSPAVITGTVADSTGAGIAGAEVTLAGTRASVRTDDRGRFRITSLQGGLVTLSARRLGFVPGSAQIEIDGATAASQVEIRLASLSTVLKPVVINADKVDYTGRLAGYYRRLEKRNAGYFISREQIDRENPRMLSQLLTHVPGVNTTRMRAGGSGVRLRGRSCWPLVWLDGLQMGTSDVDLDAFPPSTIQGIEVYPGSTTAPLNYIGSRDLSSCGTILLWSRGPDTDPVVKPGRPRVDLERLVQSLTVYTADQVDRPASEDPSHKMSVEYPAPLYASGEGGSVIVEFVVDSRGRVEEGTFGIVSSTSPLFSDAVRRGVETATFKPAILSGTPVRQLMMVPFSFAPREKGNPRS